MIEVREYIDARKWIPYREWIDTLDAGTQVRVVSAVLRLELGNFSAAKPVSAGLSELRIDFGPGYRIYFGKDGEQLVILVGGGTKRRQQADIDTAKALWAEYKRRKTEEANAAHKKL